jgi:hypothetical protein
VLSFFYIIFVIEKETLTQNIKDMANITQQLADFRMALKNELSSLLENIYINKYGQQPNWQEGEEIVIDDSALPTYRISVEVGDIHSSDNCIVEKWAVNEYRVSLDENLFFRCGDNNDEFHYDEISTDELVGIYSLIKKYFDNVEENYHQR